MEYLPWAFVSSLPCHVKEGGFQLRNVDYLTKEILKKIINGKANTLSISVCIIVYSHMVELG